MSEERPHVQNLVDNGVRHNIPEGGWVRVASDTRPDGTAVVQMTNTGPAIPRYDIVSLFEPLHRHGTDRHATTSPSAGLGLSIVKVVARAHGGDVQAQPRDGGGLIVTVTLPGTDMIMAGIFEPLTRVERGPMQRI